MTFGQLYLLDIWVADTSEHDESTTQLKAQIEASLPSGTRRRELVTSALEMLLSPSLLSPNATDVLIARLRK